MRMLLKNLRSGRVYRFRKRLGILTSVSTYIELPTIEDGYWKLVDRNPETKMYTNVSFCVYDAENKIAYLITMDS